MDASFWTSKWKEGQIGFHRPTYNESLLNHFDKLNLHEGDRILVPLCGKTKDMAWLYQQGLEVQGVELYEQAAQAFFIENGFNEFSHKKTGEFIKYAIPRLEISCGDFFKFEYENNYQAVYDRASLVALPREMRREYAKVITNALKNGGRYLLIVYSYNQEEMSGPPFSVDLEEINELYGKHFSINLLENSSPQEGSRLAFLKSFQENVYLLEKLS